MIDILAAVGAALPIITPMTILLIIILSFYRAIAEGLLIPVSTYKMVMDEKDREIKYLKQGLSEANAQISQLIELGQTNIKLVKAITPPDSDEDKP